jgi:hypothetical protein
VPALSIPASGLKSFVEVDSMKRIESLLVLLICVVVLAIPATAQQTTSPLVQLLQSKGILTAEEVAMVSQASSPGEADRRLAQLLLSKGLITQEDYQKTYGAAVVSTAAPAVTDAHLVPAVLRTRTGGSSGAGTLAAGAPAASAQAPKEPPVIPAVAPLRVLPIDVPKQSGLIPDIKLGSGANLKLYGFFKASAIEDTANSGGNLFGNDDFPLPLLLGDTGPTSGPEFHIKARSFRIGANFEWVGDKRYTVTAKVEYDSEGDFTNQNSVNISSIRNSQFRPRLAWVRLDTKLGGSLPWFAEFGQDWTILGSSTLPNLFETTGLGLGMGSFYERVPQFKTGMQFGSGSFKVQPEFAIVLPVQGSTNLSDEQRARFGDRAGSDSNQPGVQGRIVFQFPLSHSWKGVAPAQFIVSGGHARMNEIIPAGLSSATVVGATGCAVAPPGPAPVAPFTIAKCFPTGVQVGHAQNIWTTEVQLPTPWVTFVAKYYRGGDMRFYFAGQLNDVFTDLNGGTNIGVASSFSGRSIAFTCTGCAAGTGLIDVSSLRPVRGQGGFVELSFPLGRIFHADPGGRNAGWVLHLHYSTDRTNASDSRIIGTGSRTVSGAANPNGLVRTDLIDGSLLYKINRWVSFVNEVSYIDTRATNNGGKIFRGLPATQAHSWRNEFGTIFVF